MIGDIDQFSGYRIDIRSQITDSSGQVLSPVIIDDILSVNIGEEYYSIATIMAYVFLSKEFGKKFLIYRDGNPFNVQINNLTLGTQEEALSVLKTLPEEIERFLLISINEGMVEILRFARLDCTVPDKVPESRRDHFHKKFAKQYWITESGQLWSLHKGEFRKWATDRLGYHFCSWCADGKSIRVTAHRECAKRFVLNPDPTRFNVVNHLQHGPIVDGKEIKNDHYSNLDWTDQSGNMKWASMQRGGVSPADVVVIRTDDDGKETRFKSIEAASKAHGKDRKTCIRDAIAAKRTYLGYMWRYESPRKQVTIPEPPNAIVFGPNPIYLICPTEQEVYSRYLGHFVAKRTDQHGRSRVLLRIDNKHAAFFIHRLIAEALHGPISPGSVVDHLDENPSNNDQKNLNVVTQKENMIRYIERRGLKCVTNRPCLGYKDGVFRSFLNCRIAANFLGRANAVAVARSRSLKLDGMYFCWYVENKSLESYAVELDERLRPEDKIIKDSNGKIYWHRNDLGPDAQYSIVSLTTTIAWLRFFYHNETSILIKTSDNFLN